MEKRSKTISITSRFPHFYEAENVDGLLYQFVDVFGYLLEQADIDLFKVMFAHYVDKANNEGSEGFLADHKGDLDKIFALYLEALGGTSQLIQVNVKFHAAAFKNLPSLVKKLSDHSETPNLFSQYLRQQFNSKTIELIDRHNNNISPSEELQQALIDELNRCLQNSSFYQDNKAHFTEDLLTLEMRKLIQQKPQPRKALETLNRLLLEAAYPNEIEKSYAPYRERLKGLIQILRRGAATQQGIIDIVAANLGIVEDESGSEAAKKQIKLIEFMPELTWVHPPGKTATTSNNNKYSYPLKLWDKFQVENPNQVEEKIEISLQVSKDLPITELINPRLVKIIANREESVTFFGKVKPGDILSFLEDTAFLNGQPFSLKDKIPLLPVGTSEWRFEAELAEGYPVGLFGQHRFDRTTFAFPEIAVDLEMRLYKLNPGVFEVRIPWDIPGFTDKFDELGDHPRNQIAGIIDKVKAAGVLSIVTYEKLWQETHEMSDRLTGDITSTPFTEEQIAEEGEFDIGSYQVPYPGGIEHEISDKLVISGVFDYTGFDSGNGFA